MSHLATCWAFQQTGISSTAKLVLIFLADFHNHETDLCFPSRASLAEKCCCDERTITRSVQELALAGLISYESRIGTAGRKTSNTYSLLMTKGQSVPTPRDNLTGHELGINKHTIPTELDDPVLSIFANHEEPPESNNKTFWDEAVGMLMGMGVADVTSRTFVGRCLKLANGDQAEILRVLETAVANGVRDPIPYLSAALGGKKKKEKVVKNKQIADAFAELEAASERRKAQWAEELGEDYTGGGGNENHAVLQPDAHSEPPVVFTKRSGGLGKVSSRRTAEVVRPIDGHFGKGEIPTDDSRLGG